MSWIEWAEFIAAYWPQLLGAALLVFAWMAAVAVVYYNKGARDHGCTAKVAERFGGADR